MNIAQKILASFRTVMLNDTKAARKDTMADFRAKVLADPDMLNTLIDAEYERLSRQWQPVETTPGNVQLAATATKNREVVLKAAREKERETITKRFETAVTKFLWLEREMSNGKKLRNCTGAELEREGGIFLEIARHLKPTQVVDKHLNEEDIRNITARFNGKKAA